MRHFLDDPNEIPARPRIFDVSRRRFLGIAAGGFALAAFAGPARAFAPYKTGGEDMPHGLVTDPSVFVTIDADGTVTIVAHRSEMGTGSRTSLPMVLADEMGADWEKVKIVQAPGDEPKYGNQDTDGSRSMRHHIQSMRQMGATMRFMLEKAAAATWDVPMAEVNTGVHEVTHAPSGRRAGFGELAERLTQEQQPDMPYVSVPSFDELTFRDESEFRYIGKGNVPIVDLFDITTGKAVYGADVTLPGMKFAAIARPPVVGGRPLRYDDSAARQVPGVETVLGLEGSTPPAKFAPLGGIAVIAGNTWAAIQGRDLLEIEWDDGKNGDYDSAAFTQAMRETAAKPGKVMREKGDVDAAFANAAKTFAAEYSQAHMAHIPMEPPVAIASVKDGKVEIWAPVQSPYGTRTDVAAALKMSPDDVTVHVTLLGGGFGRKSKCDFVIEAALLSRMVGAPVRVQWTREDDVKHSFYHTTSVERIEVALDAAGKVTGWKHNSVAPSILSTFAPDSGHQFPIEAGMGHVDMPFDIANVRADNGEAFAHTRIGWFRSVSNVPRAFAVQSFAAELADELGRDQKEVLLELIGPARKLDPKAEGFPEDFWNYGEVYDNYPIDTGRLSHALEVAADAIGWGRALPEGEGIGLAVHRSFVTYIGCAVRTKIVDGRITVPETHFAVDCGFAANPERIRSQMEGAAVMGMTLALFSGITYENGRVMQNNFYDYDVVRADNFPADVSVHIVANPFSVHAAGVGEPGVPPFAPALANAVFNATGKRLRDMPFGDTLA
ncbi:xanthine dehydrogenase family protein molybdopterin-binding subunit [Acuticoccus sp. I52.16.1]|uniref:xanthine dehydrogenase family protein molybdopterin-binding subunit n=1 Tax=Acuticoccus sp. I52.16.1 TaxID=2928472 RepID=UPI001FD361C6|nr:molybdopterin cofactor-binding domain-containing protein [Acuticoccus sp. I52.16.1]UOM35058.1 molybdopterin-dependent oxidoreductase [Acuticoccus sp. I52.16.1]